jgi:hypothetical protein
LQHFVLREIGVNDCGAGRSAPRDSHAQLSVGELCGHPMTDRPADNPLRTNVLDRTHEDLAVAGAVLGDVGQPDRFRPSGGEVAPPGDRRPPDSAAFRSHDSA